MSRFSFLNKSHGFVNTVVVGQKISKKRRRVRSINDRDTKAIHCLAINPIVFFVLLRANRA